MHQCMPFELVDPILAARQIRLLGGPDIRSVVVLTGSVAGQMRGQLVASLLVANPCLELIFDKTWCCLDHTMVLAARRQPR